MLDGSPKPGFKHRVAFLESLIHNLSKFFIVIHLVADLSVQSKRNDHKQPQMVKYFFITTSEKVYIQKTSSNQGNSFLLRW